MNKIIRMLAEDIGVTSDRAITMLPSLIEWLETLSADEIDAIDLSTSTSRRRLIISDQQFEAMERITKQNKDVLSLLKDQ